MNDPMRDMPFPSSGKCGWRYEGGVLVPDVPAPAAPIAVAAPPSAPAPKPTAAPRRTRRTPRSKS